MLNVVLKPHRGSLRAGQGAPLGPASRVPEHPAEPQKVFAMLKLIPQAEVAQARPPLALALVIDTSGSMREFADQEAARAEAARQGQAGQPASADGADYGAVNLKLPTKLDQAMEAAHRLVDDDRLAADDQVALVRFDDDAETLLPLTPLADRDAAHRAIDSLTRFSGGTQMGRGMRCAQEQFRALATHVAKRALLLTDGKAFDDEECLALAPEFAQANTPIIAIGIGPEYNEELMRQLADRTQGRPYHLQAMEQLREILDVEVGTSVREVVTDLQAVVATVRDVRLESITRVYPSLAEVSLAEQPYRLGNIPAGDYTVFILEFTVAGMARPPSRARLARVGLSGHVPGLGRQDELEPQDIYVDFTTDEAAIAAVDPEVLGYVQQKNVDNMIQQAVRQATVDASQARRTLQVAAGMTQRLGNRAVTRILENALEELNQSGTLSAGTRKTVALGGRTRTMKPGGTQGPEGGPEGASEGVPSEAEIRRLTGA